MPRRRGSPRRRGATPRRRGATPRHRGAMPRRSRNFSGGVLGLPRRRSTPRHALILLGVGVSC